MRGPCSQCEDQYRELCPTCSLCSEHCGCQQKEPVNHKSEIANHQFPTCQSERTAAPSGVTLMVLVSQHHPTWTTVCDGRCHDSKTPVCICLCGGRFHGLQSGSAKLADAIGQHGPGLVKRWKDLGVDCSGLEKILNESVQL